MIDGRNVTFVMMMIVMMMIMMRMMVMMVMVMMMMKVKVKVKVMIEIEPHQFAPQQTHRLIQKTMSGYHDQTTSHKK